MRQALWLCSLLVILSSFVSAKDKAIPAVIVNARYVLVTTYSGDDQTNARMMPDDRKAASDVQTALSKWGRYVVVYQPQDADIIIRIHAKDASPRRWLEERCISARTSPHQQVQPVLAISTPPMKTCWRCTTLTSAPILRPCGGLFGRVG